MCCVQYKACSDAGSFSLDASVQDPDPATQLAIFDSVCTGDYVGIEGELESGLLGVTVRTHLGNRLNCVLICYCCGLVIAPDLDLAHQFWDFRLLMQAR